MVGGMGASRTGGALRRLEGLGGGDVRSGAVCLEARERGGLERGRGADAGEVRAVARRRELSRQGREDRSTYKLEQPAEDAALCTQLRMHGSMPAVLVGAAADELCAAAAPTRARSAKTAFILVGVGFVSSREEGRACLTEEAARRKAR